MSRKKRRRTLRKKKETDSGPVFQLLNSPLANIPEDVLTKGLVEVGQSQEREFNDLLSKLTSLVSSVEPLHLLSALSTYGLFVGISKTGETSEQKRPTLLQPHVELIQAIVLMKPANEQSQDYALPDTVQAIWDTLRPISDAFAMQRLVQVEKASTDRERKILTIQERLRNHTHMVRNWGFYKKVISITKRLYEPLNALYEEQIGIGATTLIEIFENLVMRSETTVSQHWQEIRPVFRARTIEQAVRAYYEAFPSLAGSPESLIDYFKEHQMPLEAVHSITLSHHDLRLREVFTFSIDDLASTASVNSTALSKAFSRLCHSFGDLRDVNPIHLFLSNPVWTKPLIRLTDDTFFCSIPQMFFSFIFRIMDEVLGQDSKTRKALFKRRATFLEDEVVRVMTEAFPQAEYVRNYEWRDGDTQYESDLLLKIDSYLLLVEAKSGTISWPALRGAPDRVERHIRELIIDPAIQSLRLSEKLMKS